MSDKPEYTENYTNSPLAFRMRPRVLDEFIGQEHIVGKGRLLRRAILSDQLSSLIFSGPPGSGKTTLARIIANHTKSTFTQINAVLAGIAELRKTIAQAQQCLQQDGSRTIVFVDEVHRWNKAQQDALLPWVENGTIIFVAATTENPFFEVNNALLSRSRIFLLKTLQKDDLRSIIQAALQDAERGYGEYRIHIDDDALEHLLTSSAGDARNILNALELAVETTPVTFPPPPGTDIHITLDVAEESIQNKAVLYDKEGDYHYDTISAFIKSVRGSDPDAALYWLARMISAGESGRFILRRLLILASEDIGLADPHALPLVQAAAAAFDQVGMPEGNYFLAEATLYLATAEKSNSVQGFFEALKAVQTESGGEVPNHLKDSSRDSYSFGHGAQYRYPHNYLEHWVAQQYLPDALKGRLFYHPKHVGYESSIANTVFRRREAQLAADVETSLPEILTFTPGNTQERWYKRVIAESSTEQEELRRRVFTALTLARHARAILLGSASELFAWELIRSCPEGELRICTDERSENIIRYIGSQLEEVQQPKLYENYAALASDSYTAEILISYNTILQMKAPSLHEQLKQIHMLCGDKGTAVFVELVPTLGMRLSDCISEENPFREQIISVEQEIYDANTEDIRAALHNQGFHEWNHEIYMASGIRHISRKQIETWFGEGLYGQAIRKKWNDKMATDICTVLLKQLANQDLEWKRAYLIVHSNAH